jgi:N-dimethylarginine dimethylaminohydrolase
MPLNVMKHLPIALMTLDESMLMIVAPNFPKLIQEELEKIEDVFGIYVTTYFQPLNKFLETTEEKEDLTQILERGLSWEWQHPKSCCCLIKINTSVVKTEALKEELERFFREDCCINVQESFEEIKLRKVKENNN